MVYDGSTILAVLLLIFTVFFFGLWFLIAISRWVFRINKIVSELEAMRKALERLMSQPPDSP